MKKAAWALALLVASFSCSGKPHNVILISIDTLRADYLRLYHREGVATPALERIAKESFVFEDVSTTSPFTLPSHAALFTGRYPFANGVRDNESGSLDLRETTLAEVLRESGFRTGGFAGAIVLAESTGIAQGFEHYDDVFAESDARFSDLGGVQKPAGRVLDGFRRWLRKISPEDRFFAFLHFYDPHAPYEPPARFLPGGERSLDARYRGEIAYVDSVVGKVDELLKSRGLEKTTLLVVTADHGEMLGEHGEEGHGFFVYQPVLQVPLLIRVPGESGARLSGIAQLTDVMPTVLDLAGLEVPAGVQGVSLRDRIEGRDNGTGRTAYAESTFANREYGASPLYALRDGTHKYVRSLRPELYDLSTDPSETVDRADPERRERLERALAALLQGSAEPIGSVDPKRIEELQALGYLSGGGGAEEPVDAKDVIDEWNDRMRAHALARERRFAEALDLIPRLPHGIDRSVLEARIHLGMGDFAKAVQLLPSGSKDPRVISTLAELELVEGNVEGAAAIQLELYEQTGSFLIGTRYARLLAQQGRVEEAIAFIDRESRSPEEAAARAEFYLDLGEFFRAERHFAELVSGDALDLSAQTGLARAMARGGDVLGAISRLEALRGTFSEEPHYLLQLGLLYHRAEQTGKEVETFRELCAIAPDDPRAHFYLGKALLDSGAPPDSVATVVQAGLSLSPPPEWEIFGRELLESLP